MSWTEDRVSLLKKLWGDGHTAAEIAKRLGGVTRNAVIGKAHRLKLSSRVSPIQQNKKPANKNVKRRNNKVSTDKAKKAQSISDTVKVKDIDNVGKQDLSVDTSKELYNLMDLKPRMCRWPYGDPKESGFGFCGDRAVSGIPYCEEHAKIAYQVSTRNRIFNNSETLNSDDDVVGDEKVAM